MLQLHITHPIDFIIDSKYSSFISFPYSKKGVIFTNLDDNLRHPSQLYEAFLEGVVLFFVMNFILLNKNYKVGHCSSLFLIFYGIFRIFSEFFREPDVQLGYIYEILSMGMILSLFMIIAGLIIYLKKNEKKS